MNLWVHRRYSRTVSSGYDKAAEGHVEFSLVFHHFTVEGGVVAAERAVPFYQLQNCDKEIGF